jgi:hypothetical protein
VIAAALLVVAATAVALPAPQDGRPPSLAVERTTTLLAHSNSRAGRAILSAADLKPGDRRSGEVTIRNEGGAGALALATRVDGLLADRLRLTVADARSGEVLLAAPLGDVPECVALVDLPAGAARTYRFTATFESGPDDNRHAGTSASADFEWLPGCGAEAEAQPQHDPVRNTPLTLGDTRVAIAPGPYRFSGRTGTAKVGVRCIAAAAGRCTGRIELERRAPGRGRGIALAVGRFTVRAGKQRTITLKLNARARRHITTTGLVPVRAFVTATDANGRRHRAAYRDRLRYSRR